VIDCNSLFDIDVDETGNDGNDDDDDDYAW
jgi:hypothetical protein